MLYAGKWETNMKNNKRARELRKMERQGLFFCIILLHTTIGESLMRYFMAELFSKIINRFNSWSVDIIIQYGILIAFILFVGAISSYLNSVFSEKSIQKGQERLQEKLRNSINGGSYRKIEQIEYGKYHTLLTSDTEKVSSFYPTVIFQMIGGAIQFSLAMYFIFRNSWEYALIILGITSFSFLVSKLFKPNLKKARNTVQEKEGFIRTFFSNSLEKVGLIKVYRGEKLEEKELKNVHKKYGESLINQQTVFAKMLSTNNLTSFLAVMLQSFIKIWFVSMGKLTIGALFGLSQLSSSINWPFWWMPVLVNNLSQTEVSAERLAEFVDSVSVQKEERKILKNSIPVLSGQNISFSYGDDSVFEDFSFAVNKNEILGLTWKSGDGKSTLIKLISGLYSPQKGQIVQNRENLSFAYATQRETFFSDSIEKNIALSENVDSIFFKKALEKSSVDFIGEEHSKTTQLNKNGQPLSGGQQKRINLARAFYHDSDILILDEPTASLDKETKAKVLEAIQKEKAKRPIILITHDKETFEICDRVI